MERDGYIENWKQNKIESEWNRKRKIGREREKKKKKRESLFMREIKKEREITFCTIIDIMAEVGQSSHGN